MNIDDYMKRFVVSILFLLPIVISAQEYAGEEIWNTGKYSAFTSLLYVNNRFYCAFREASEHRAVLDNSSTMGEIVIISSSDGIKWELYTRFQEAKCDLRDPKLSLTPDGRLMLLYFQKTYDSISSKTTTFVSFLDLKSKKITQPTPIIIKNYDKSYKWLWEVVWYKGVAYGFMYGSDFLFLKSTDGINYEILSKSLPCGEKATEVSLLFNGNKAIAVARGIDDKARYGESKFPYTKWKWTKMNMAVGGPALIKLPNEKVILGTRNYQEDIGMTSLYWLRKQHSKKIITLNKDRDSSYPSFALVNDMLYVSYYSGNHSHTAIKLSKIPLYLLNY